MEKPNIISGIHKAHKLRGQVEAGGLQPWTTYNYQFTVCDSDNSSPIGRTKTSPASDADVDEVKLAVFSCSNYRESPTELQA